MRKSQGAVLATLVVCGCAVGGGMPTPPAPSEIPALEAQYRAAPGNAQLRARLASAYRAGNRPEDAVALLEPIAATASPAASVTLAGAYEDLARFEDARAIYTRLAGTTSGALQRAVRARLEGLRRLELQYAVVQALAREEELSQTAPTPNTVGIFPFLFESTNETLVPLSRAMAELLTVDLSQTDRLRVVERAQLQYLLEELELAESARVDTLTAARAGRLVGAGRIVQGRIGGAGEDVSLQAAVVQVEGPEGVRLIDQEGSLSNLFDLEKQLALSIYDAMGVQLTVAERQRVNRRQTENVQALLAFGYGLEAADGGRYAEAVQHFDRAAALDPGFDLADAWRDRAQAEGVVETQGQQELFRVASGGDPAGEDWISAREPFIQVEQLIPEPQGRDAVQEVLGVEGLERGAILQIIIRRPTGGTP